MKHLYRIAPLGCACALFGFMALTGCEGGDIFEVDSPDWLSEVVDSIANSSSSDDEEELEGQMEDVYTFGETDYSSSFYTAFSKYYVIPDGEIWQAVVTLHINPDDNTYYKNMILYVTNDEDRSASDYAEYGAWRYDATTDTATYNSQWGDWLYFKYTDCNNYMSPDDDSCDELLQSMDGKVTITVDRTDPDSFYMCLSNSTITKTYTQPYALPNLNADESNTDIRCWVTVEGSYIDWVSTNIEPIGGCTSSEDKEPVSMELDNLPDQVTVGTTLEDALADVTATVTFEEDVTKDVTAEDLTFTVISGDIEEVGDVTVVAVYNTTYNGDNAATAVVASFSFEVVEVVTAIEVYTEPSHQTYYYYVTDATSSASHPAFEFDPTGMVVMATYADGSTRQIDNSKLSFTTVDAEDGTYTVTISTTDGPTAETTISVASSSVTTVTNSESVVGEEDNSTGWWSVFSDDFIVSAGTTAHINFTNYTDAANNWDNFCVVLRSADGETTEYGVLRADNYGWDTLWSDDDEVGYSVCTTNGGQDDWSTWLADMDGAEVDLYVTNCANGSVDVQAIMASPSGTTYYQYYLGITGIDADDFSFALTCEAAHLVFE